MQQSSNISNWSKQKLLQFVEDNTEAKSQTTTPAPSPSEAGTISFMFSRATTLGWLNRSGDTVTLSRKGTAGGTLDDYTLYVGSTVVSGSSIDVPDGSLFKVVVEALSDAPAYISWKVQ